MNLKQEWLLWDIKGENMVKQHSPLSEENAFWHAVASGDIDYVRRDCAQKSFTEKEGLGILARNPVVNLKYHFVIAAALIARLCLNSGMEMEQAFRLSDFYILKLENLDTIQAISELHEQMVLDFTGKMRLLAKNSGASKPVTDCIEYIYTHLQERVTVSDLSAHTGFSAGYLSRAFKKELGVSISDYIRDKKMERAQELLRYSNYSLIDISNQLAFSSQSHFTQQFRAFTGLTPKKYRDLHSVGERNLPVGDPSENIVPPPAGIPDSSDAQ